MSTLAIPPALDALGNLRIHGRQGVYIPIQFQSQGVPYDASTSIIHFEVAGVMRVALAPAPVSARFSGSIAGTVMTAGTVTYGAIAAGMVVSGAGVAADTSITLDNGNGTYVVAPSQTVASGAMTATDNSIRVLALDAAQVAALPLPTTPNGPPISLPYVILDETGQSPTPAMSGLVTAYGFNVQPPTGAS